MKDIEDSSGTQDLRFHYNRDKRLQRAPENVKKAYELGYTPNKGFIKGLTANAGLKSVFFSIIILSALIVILTLSRDPTDSISLDDMSLSVKAFLFEEKIYTTISVSGYSKNEATPVLFQIRAIDIDNQIVSQREVPFDITADSKPVRLILDDFAVQKVQVSTNINNSSVVLSVLVDRN